MTALSIDESSSLLPAAFAPATQSSVFEQAFNTFLADFYNGKVPCYDTDKPDEFNSQFQALIGKISWLVDQTNLEATVKKSYRKKLEKFTKNFFEKWEMTTLTQVFFATIKINLEKICFLLQKHSENSAEVRGCLKRLLVDIGACPFGVYQHVELTLSSLQNATNLENLLFKLRRDIINQLAGQHSEVKKIPDGNQIHVINVFFQLANDYGWNPGLDGSATVLDDKFANVADVGAEDIEKFCKEFWSRYSAETVIEYLTDFLGAHLRECIAERMAEKPGNKVEISNNEEFHDLFKNLAMLRELRADKLYSFEQANESSNQEPDFYYGGLDCYFLDRQHLREAVFLYCCEKEIIKVRECQFKLPAKGDELTIKYVFPADKPIGIVIEKNCGGDQITSIENSGIFQDQVVENLTVEFFRESKVVINIKQLEYFINSGINNFANCVIKFRSLEHLIKNQGILANCILHDVRLNLSDWRQLIKLNVLNRVGEAIFPRVTGDCEIIIPNNQPSSIPYNLLSFAFRGNNASLQKALRELFHSKGSNTLVPVPNSRLEWQLVESLIDLLNDDVVRKDPSKFSLIVEAAIVDKKSRIIQKLIKKGFPFSYDLGIKTLQGTKQTIFSYAFNSDGRGTVDCDIIDCIVQHANFTSTVDFDFFFKKLYRMYLDNKSKPNAAKKCRDFVKKLVARLNEEHKNSLHLDLPGKSINGMFYTALMISCPYTLFYLYEIFPNHAPKNLFKLEHYSMFEACVDSWIYYGSDDYLIHMVQAGFPACRPFDPGANKYNAYCKNKSLIDYALFEQKSSLIDEIICSEQTLFNERICCIKTLTDLAFDSECLLSKDFLLSAIDKFINHLILSDALAKQNKQDLKNAKNMLSIIYDVATDQGQASIVYKLYKLGVTPGVRHANQTAPHEPPLFTAVKAAKVDFVRALVQFPETITQIFERKSAVLVAAEHGQWECVNIIIDNLCSLPAKLMLDKVLLLAAKAGQSEIVARLSEKGVNLNHHDPENGYTALHYAAVNNNAAMLQTLLKHNADATLLSTPNAQPGRLKKWWFFILTHILKFPQVYSDSLMPGKTAVQLAAEQGNWEIVTLIAQQYPERVQDEFRYGSALWRAAKAGEKAVVASLAKAGASTNWCSDEAKPRVCDPKTKELTELNRQTTVVRVAPTFKLAHSIFGNWRLPKPEIKTDSPEHRASFTSKMR